VMPVSDVAKMSPVEEMPRYKHNLCAVEFADFALMQVFAAAGKVMWKSAT